MVVKSHLQGHVVVGAAAEKGGLDGFTTLPVSLEGEGAGLLNGLELALLERGIVLRKKQ